MKFWLLQIRHGLAVWLGPLLLLTGLVCLVAAGVGVLGGKGLAAGCVLLFAGIIRAAFQTRHLPCDTEVTRLPAGHDTGGGTNG